MVVTTKGITGAEVGTGAVTGLQPDGDGLLSFDELVPLAPEGAEEKDTVYVATGSRGLITWADDNGELMRRLSVLGRSKGYVDPAITRRDRAKLDVYLAPLYEAIRACTSEGVGHGEALAVFHRYGGPVFFSAVVFVTGLEEFFDALMKPKKFVPAQETDAELPLFDELDPDPLISAQGDTDGLAMFSDEENLPLYGRRSAREVFELLLQTERHREITEGLLTLVAKSEDGRRSLASVFARLKDHEQQELERMRELKLAPPRVRFFNDDPTIILRGRGGPLTTESMIKRLAAYFAR